MGLAQFSSRLFIGLFLVANLPVASASAAPRVELYTMGRGEALFSKFGHAALCVVDRELPAGGLCYNYGTSDFSRPIGLAWDVVRGQATFWVSVSDWVGMVTSFESQDRSIYRQVLPLSEEQAEALAAALAHDARPENRAYIYSHFLDNCSTRPRDLIDEATEGVLRRSTLENQRTYRDYAREGFAAFHWILVPAGDLILGRWVDQDIGVFEAMFIPEVLAQAVTAELGAVPETVYERRGPPVAGDVGAALFRFWIVVLVLVALAWVSRWGGIVAIGLVSLLGLVVWTGALLSPWPELRVNELVVVLVPFDIVLVRRSASRAYVVARLAMLAAVAILAVVGVFVQPLSPYWVLAAGTLSSFWWRQRKDILAT